MNKKRAKFVDCIVGKYFDFEIMIDVPFLRKKIGIELGNGVQCIRAGKQRALYLSDESKESRNCLNKISKKRNLITREV